MTAELHHASDRDIGRRPWIDSMAIDYIGKALDIELNHCEQNIVGSIPFQGPFFH